MSGTLWLGPLAALGASVTWAIGSGGYASLSRNHTAFAVNFARALFGLPLFVLAAFLTAGGWSGGLDAFAQLRWAHLGWFTLSMIGSYSVGDALFLWSTNQIGVPAALAVASSYPLWTALAGVIHRGEVLSRYQWGGLLLTLSGVVTVILFSPSPPQAAGAQSARSAWSMTNSRAKGFLLAFGTSILWAANSFALSSGGRDVASSVGNSLRMVIALIFCAGLSRLFAPRRSFLLPGVEWRRFWWVFLVDAFCGSYLFMYGLSHSPLAIGTILSSLAPVLSVPVAWSLGLEKPTLPRSMGLLFVVMGLSLLLGGIP